MAQNKQAHESAGRNERQDEADKTGNICRVEQNSRRRKRREKGTYHQSRVVKAR